MKKQQNIRFSGAVTSHQNVAAERAIKTVVTMASTMLIHAALICPEDTFPTDIWQMAMDYAVWIYNRIPICSIDYPLLKYGQGQGFSQCQKPLANVMFGVVQHIF